MEFSRQNKLNELIASQNNHMIKIITGLRRCGKSYLLNTIFKNYLLANKVKESNIITFAFDFDEDIDKLDKYYEDEPTKVHIKGTKNLYNINSKKFRAYIKELTKKKGFYYLLLDEVQYLENFSGTLNGFLNYENYDVYVTGSNSKFLSSDIATEFRGRGDVIKLYPLSYKEIYETLKGDKNNLLYDYLKYGGLPLCVLSKTNEKKERYLETLYNTIYTKDLIEHSRIKNEDELKELMEVVSSSIGALTSTDNIANTFSSKKHSHISNVTVAKYLSFVEDSFLILKTKRYNIKGRKYIGSPYKYYFTDLGIRNVVLNFRQFEITHLMENLIYNELLYRGFNVDVGVVNSYKKNKTGTNSLKFLEVDFVANKGSKKYYIQSAYSIEEEKKKEQEEKSLMNIDDSFAKIIIVHDDIKPYYNDKGILIIGLLNFLLDDHLIV